MLDSQTTAVAYAVRSRASLFPPPFRASIGTTQLSGLIRAWGFECVSFSHHYFLLRMKANALHRSSDMRIRAACSATVLMCRPQFGSIPIRQASLFSFSSFTAFSHSSARARNSRQRSLHLLTSFGSIIAILRLWDGASPFWGYITFATARHKFTMIAKRNSTAFRRKVYDLGRVKFVTKPVIAVFLWQFGCPFHRLNSQGSQGSQVFGIVSFLAVFGIFSMIFQSSAMTSSTFGL